MALFCHPGMSAVRSILGGERTCGKYGKMSRLTQTGHSNTVKLLLIFDGANVR